MTRAQIDLFIENYKDDIESEQATYLATHGKYKQYLKGQYSDVLEVHEYVRPDDSVGYVIYVYAVESSINYFKSFNVGSELITTYSEWIIYPEIT